jgi:hypothetical protein
VDLSRVAPPAAELERLRALTQRPTDWAQVLEAARALRTVPLVDAVTTALGEVPWIPAEIRKTLWMEAESWRRWNASLVEEGEQVVAALGGEGLRVVPIKGFDYARRLYPRIGLRPMVDLDLLLPRADLDPAAAFLKGRMGYREGPDAEASRHARIYRKRVLNKGEGEDRRCLDLHSVFYHPELYPIDYDDLWRRVGSQPSLPDEDCLCLSCLILAKDRYQADLRDLVDIHEITRRWAPDWGLVLDRARAWGATAALFFSLSSAKGVLNTEVPEEILRASRPGWVRRTWLKTFLATDRFPTYRFAHGSLLPKILIRLPLADSVRGWIRFLTVRARHRMAD